MGRPPLFTQKMTNAERQRRYSERQARNGADKEDNMASVSQLRASPLPTTRSALEASRVLKRRPTILDLIEPIVIALWEDENFTKLVDAVVDSDSVEGSTDADDQEAARMIREYAKSNRHPEVAKRNLKTLTHALRLVLKRFGQGRAQRVNEPEPQIEALQEAAQIEPPTAK